MDEPVREHLIRWGAADAELSRSLRFDLPGDPAKNGYRSAGATLATGTVFFFVLSEFASNDSKRPAVQKLFVGNLALLNPGNLKRLPRKLHSRDE